MSTRHTSKEMNQRIQKKKENIIKNTVELFYAKGYQSTSMRDICKATGMTMGNLYNYIGKKEDLLFMVHDHLMKNIYDSLGDPTQTEWKNREELRSALKFYFVQCLKVKKEGLLTVREMWLMHGPKRKALLDKHRNYISKLKDRLDKGVEAGFLNIQNTQITASFISYCLSLPVQRAWTLRQYKGRQEEMIDDLVNIIMKTLT